VVRLSALHTSRFSLPRDITVLISVKRPKQHQGHSAGRTNKSMKKPSDPIGNQTRDLWYCKAECRPTASQRTATTDNLSHHHTDTVYLHPHCITPYRHDTQLVTPSHWYSLPPPTLHQPVPPPHTTCHFITLIQFTSTHTPSPRTATTHNLSRHHTDTVYLHPHCIQFIFYNFR
jgi:hypothetical protein